MPRLRKLFNHTYRWISLTLILSIWINLIAQPGYIPGPITSSAKEAKVPASKTKEPVTKLNASTDSSSSSSPKTDKPAPAASQDRVNEAYGKLPMSFEANQGQADSRVRFLSRGRGYVLFLTQTEAVMVLSKRDTESGNAGQGDRAVARQKSKKGSPAVLRMGLVGANSQPKITGLDELSGKSNYFIGKDPERWQRGVSNFVKVKFEAVYPGVEMVYYGNQRQLEYDFVVSPGADPRAIKIGYDGIRKLKIDSKGDLILLTANGEVRQHKPIVYQEIKGVRQEINSRYVIAGKRQVGFEIGDYDREQPLVIDPVLSYSMYLGGGDDEQGNGIAVDSSGNAYVTGYTNSTNFPVANGAQSSIVGPNDVFVTKLNSTGTTLLYSTYLGGSGGEDGKSIAVDSSGSAYLTGSTTSRDFPLANALQATYGGGTRDAFVTKIDPGGSTLAYSTYLGGRSQYTDDYYETYLGSDVGYAIAVDSSGNAYVAGQTDSELFPVENAAQWSKRGESNDADAFVTKLNSTGTAYLYSTFLGGSIMDGAYGIAVDASGHAYVTGYTDSIDFPSANPMQVAKAGNTDAFVTKLSPTGTAFLYSTYLGGTNIDIGKGIVVDATGNAYIAGDTSSNNFPTVSGSYSTTYRGGAKDSFVTKLDPLGATRIYSTYLGGNSGDYSTAIALDSSGNVYVAGASVSTNFPPTTGSISAKPTGPYDIVPFIIKLNTAGASLIYSTFLGGAQTDYINAIAVDGAGHAYVTGSTASPDFPTNPDAFQINNNGGQVFLSKILDAGSFSISGRLTDASSAGINAVPVTVSGSQTRTVLTDDNGNYWIGGLAAGGNYTVTPSPAKYTFSPPSQSFTNLTANQTLNFSGVLKTYLISGTVTDASGGGMSAVTMTLDGSQTGTVDTNASGSYSFVVNAGGAYTITPYKDGSIFSPPNRTFEDLSANQTANFTVGYSISGQAVNAAGTGLSYVTVTLSGSKTGTITSDYYGNFSFMNLARGGNYTVTVSKTGYNFAPANRSFNNLSADQTADFTGSTYTISGRITRADGTGVNNVTLNLSGTHSDAVYTDANGYYTFLAVAPGGSFTVTPSSPTNVFTPTSLSFSNVSANQTADFTSQSYAIQGFVTDYYGFRLMNVRVRLSGSLSGTSFTSYDGSYGFSVAPGGTYTITPEYDDFSGYIFSPGSKTFTNLSSTQIFNFTVGPIKLSGHVTDEYGNDILYGPVELTGSQTGTMTIRDGFYTFYVMPGGTYTVAPWGAATPTSATFSNVQTDQTADFSLTYDNTITGRVEAANRVAIGSVTVTLNGSQTVTMQTDANGKYNFTGLTEGGNYWVTVSKPGYAFAPQKQNFNNLDLGIHTADFTALTTASIPLKPTADSYVTSGNASANFGRAAELQVYNSSPPAAQSETYMTFDMSGIAGSIASAKLRLYGRLSDASGTNVVTSVYSVADTTWAENGATGIRWNNKPATSGVALSNFTVVDNTEKWYDVDVTAYVNAEKSAGRNVVSLALKNGSASPYTVFNSREASGNRPEMVLTTTPAISAISPTSGTVGTVVTVTGINFGSQQGTSALTFNGVAATPTSWTGTSITAPVPTGASTGPVKVTVEGVDSNGATFTITNSGSISGTITRASDGAAINGATVQALQDGLVKATVTTASNGSYTINNLLAGTYDVRASATGYATTTRTGNTVASSSNTNANIALPSAGTISGKVTKTDGTTAISGASVNVYQGATLTGTATTNATGDYSVTGLSAGVYTLEASATGYATKSQTSITVNTGATTTVNVSLTATSAVYHLHTEASTTAGLSQLKTANPDAVSAALQTADLKSQAIGEKLIKAFDTQAGVPNMSGVITAGSTISFALWMKKTAALGTMFPRAKLLLNSAAGTSLCTATGTTALSTTLTKYTLTCNVGSDVTVSSTDRFYLWTGVNLTVGATTATFKAELDIEGTLNGNYDSTVTVPLPLAVPNIASLSPTSGQVGATVTVTGSNFGTTQGTSTIKFNGVTATPISWNNTTITVPVPPGALTGPVLVTVNGLPSNTVTFTVTSPGTISGTITRASDGVAVSGATVQALQYNVVKVSVTSAANGSYSITGLTPGTYDVRVSASGYGTAIRTGNDVVGGVTATVNVALSSPGTISGKITNAAGTALSGAVVNVYQGTVVAGTATTNATGDYSVGGLSAGTYTLEASASGYQAKSQTGVVVNAGLTTTLNMSLNAAAATYRLHNEASTTSGLAQLKVAGPDAVSVALQTAELNGQATGEKLVKAFDTQAGVPNSTGVIPANSSLSFALWMKKTAALGTMFPRAKLLLNSAAGTSLCTATGTTALSTTLTKYTLTCNVGSDVTVSSTDRFYLWTGINLTTASSSGSFKGELDIEGTLNGNYDSLVSVPLPLVAPNIASLSPTSGQVGATVTVTGSNFGATRGASAISFNGVAATSLTWNNTTIVATVPSGALTGPVIVTVNGLSSNAVTFSVNTFPTIMALAPSSGPIGASVTISGINFGGTQGNSTIKFNGVIAPPSSWNATSLGVIVPSGITTGPVIVTVGGVDSNGFIFTVAANNPATDTDGDGLPDSWEMQYFGSLNQTAGGDFDGDGVSNLTEYQQGRNPTKGETPDTGGAVNLKVYTTLESSQ